MQDPSATPEVDQDEVQLLPMLRGLMRMLVRRKWLMTLMPLAAALLSGLFAYLVLPDTYTASARILPPSMMPSASAALMAQMGGAAGPALNLMGLRNPADIYVAMLKSRTTADAIITKFNLGTRYGQEYPSETRRVLAKLTRIAFERDGVISIDVNDVEPVIAMELANAYLDQLAELTRSMALSEATQRRVFYEQQLVQARDKLTEAETRARQAMNHGGLVNVEAQGQSLLATTARLRGQISATEVQIAAMRGYATATNPALLQAQRELAALRQELAKSEGAGGTLPQSGAGNNDNLRLLREVKYDETLYEVLAKQYEMARLDEAKDPGGLRVLDRPVQPDLPSGPNRIVLILVATLAAGLLALILAALLDAIARHRSPAPSQH